MTATVRLDEVVIGERSRTEARNLESLAHSIREHSLIQPPVVRRDGDRYVLVCGLRRIAAVRSLGWAETPVTVAETIADELAALYAEGDENTEREPFTAVEAVEHRRRIREAEARAAKERQRAAGPAAAAKRRVGHNAEPLIERPEEPNGYGNFPEPLPGPAPHMRTTRERAAKATGYSGRTLDKAEVVIETAADESQPEPVRQVAKQAAANLAQHGAKVDREHRAVQDALDTYSDQAPGRQDAKWRSKLLTELGRIGDLKTYDPERVVALCDDDQLFVIDSVCERVAEWHAEIKRLRRPGLRLLRGGER